MTRREEFEEKANQFLAGGRHFNAVDLARLLAQVERECWEKMERKAIEKGDFNIPPFDDWEHGYEKACKQIVDWCRAQKEAV